MIVSKVHLARRIKKRFGGQISQRVIIEVINTIIDVMKQELLEDRTISVKNFGTLSPYIYHGHNAFNVVSGEKVYVESFRSVRFHTHAGMRNLMSKANLGQWARKKSGR